MRGFKSYVAARETLIDGLLRSGSITVVEGLRARWPIERA